MPERGRRMIFGGAAVHPLSIAALRLTVARWLRQGNPASPEACCLRLLPSGPDLVHSSSPRGTRPSTPRDVGSPTETDLEGEFDPARAGCGYRAPLAPHLARPRHSLPRFDPLGPTPSLLFRRQRMVGGPLDRRRPRVRHVGVVSKTADHADGQIAAHLHLTGEPKVFG